MQLSGINTNLAVALDALLREQNVSRAARAVGLRQSSMSHALARLRAHFRDPLLVPSGRNMVLTARGRALMMQAQVAVANLDRLFLRSREFDPKTSDRTFHLVATDNLELYLLPRLVPLLEKEAPRVQLRLHHLPHDWMETLANGAIELKLGRKSPVQAPLRSEDLFEERLACFVREKHPLASARLTAKQFAEMRFVAVKPYEAIGGNGRDDVDDLLAEQGVTRQVLVTVPHFLVAPHAIMESDLGLIASERLFSCFAKPLHLRKLELPMRLPKFTLSQVWTERSEVDEGHRWLRRAISRVCTS